MQAYKTERQKGVQIQTTGNKNLFSRYILTDSKRVCFSNNLRHIELKESQ